MAKRNWAKINAIRAKKAPMKTVFGSPQFEPKTPLATDMFAPNHSGIADHPEMKDIVSELTKYVDDSIAAIPGGVTDHTLLTNIGTTTHADIDLAIADHPHQDVTTTARPGWTGISECGNIDSNVIIGVLAGNVIEASGINNILLGNNAGLLLTTGDGNVAIGASALASCTTNNDNTAIGKNACLITTGNNNVAFGAETLKANIVGGGNVAIGYSALAKNTASNNLAIGPNTAAQITGGTGNIGLGSYTLYGTKANSGNVGIGYNCLMWPDGANNLAMGYEAGKGVNGQNFSYSVLLGFQAGKKLRGTGSYSTFLGSSCGSNVTTGANNILLGYGCGNNLTTGSDNLLFGHTVVASAADVSNELNIDNTLKGDTSTKELRPQGDFIFEGAGSGLPYGEIYGADVASVISISASGKANYNQVTSFATDGNSNLMDVSHSEDHITVSKAGIYLCNVSMHLNSIAGGTAEVYGYSVYKNNGTTEFLNLHGQRNMAGSGGDEGSVSLSGIIDLDVNDTVEVWIWNNTNADDVEIDDINLSLVQIGGT